MTRWQVDNRGARRLKQLRAVAPGVVRNRIRQADKRTGVLPKQGVQLKRRNQCLTGHVIRAAR